MDSDESTWKFGDIAYTRTAAHQGWLDEVKIIEVREFDGQSVFHVDMIGRDPSFQDDRYYAEQLLTKEAAQAVIDEMNVLV